MTAGPRSCAPAFPPSGQPWLDGLWLGPQVLSGQGLLFRSHLLAKMLWILNGESLISPAVLSAASTNLLPGLYQRIYWNSLS